MKLKIKESSVQPEKPKGGFYTVKVGVNIKYEQVAENIVWGMEDLKKAVMFCEALERLKKLQGGGWLYLSFSSVEELSIEDLQSVLGFYVENIRTGDYDDHAEQYYLNYSITYTDKDFVVFDVKPELTSEEKDFIESINFGKVYWNMGNWTI